MTDLYAVISSLFGSSLTHIQEGIKSESAQIFNSSFFTLSLALGIVISGYLIATKKLKTEEIAHKIIWTLLVFSFVKGIVTSDAIYDYTLGVLNQPRDLFMGLMKSLVTKIDGNADLESIINSLKVSIYSVSSSLFSHGGWSNVFPFVYGIIIWISGTFLIVLILLNSVFSIFLSDLIMSLLPFVVITLLSAKTEYIFFNWIKLYISISLYAPFTILMGLVAVHVSKYTEIVSLKVKEDVESNLEVIFALVIAQALCSLAIFKIPNIINQLIGSANEGSSMTSGVGTIATGATIIGGMSKYSGATFAAKSGYNGVAKKMSDIRTGIDKVNI